VDYVDPSTVRVRSWMAILLRLLLALHDASEEDVKDTKDGSTLSVSQPWETCWEGESTVLVENVCLKETVNNLYWMTYCAVDVLDI